jgi:hypothetical protein
MGETHRWRARWVSSSLQVIRTGRCGVSFPKGNAMRHALLVLLTALASPAIADGYARVTERAAFVALVGDKSLTNLGVTLNVTPDGTIGGRAFGRDISGRWTWDDGYFCRTMQAGDRAFPRNCQVVQNSGDRIRFIADRGTGETADLRIR